MLEAGQARSLTSPESFLNCLKRQGCAPSSQPFEKEGTECSASTVGPQKRSFRSFSRKGRGRDLSQQHTLGKGILWDAHGLALPNPHFPQSIQSQSSVPAELKGPVRTPAIPGQLVQPKIATMNKAFSGLPAKASKTAPWPVLIYILQTPRHSTKKCNSPCLKTISASLSAAKGTNKTVGIYPHGADEQLKATTEPRDGFCTFQVRQIQTASPRPWLCICCQPFSTVQQEQGLEAPYRNYKSCCQQQQSFRDALIWHTGWQLWDVTKKLRHETTTQSLSLGRVSPVFAVFLPRDFQHFVLDKKIQKKKCCLCCFSLLLSLPLYSKLWSLMIFAFCPLATSFHNSCQRCFMQDDKV